MKKRALIIHLYRIMGEKVHERHIKQNGLALFTYESETFEIISGDELDKTLRINVLAKLKSIDSEFLIEHTEYVDRSKKAKASVVSSIDTMKVMAHNFVKAFLQIVEDEDKMIKEMIQCEGRAFFFDSSEEIVIENNNANTSYYIYKKERPGKE